MEMQHMIQNKHLNAWLYSLIPERTSLPHLIYLIDVRTTHPGLEKQFIPELLQTCQSEVQSYIKTSVNCLKLLM